MNRSCGSHLELQIGLLLGVLLYDARLGALLRRIQAVFVQVRLQHRDALLVVLQLFTLLTCNKYYWLAQRPSAIPHHVIT